MSSHKIDWILIELPWFALSCLLYRMVSSLLNALEAECFCLCEISIIVNKLLAVLLLPVLFIRYFLYCTFLSPVYFLILLFLYWCCCCLFTSLSPFFILKLLLYFWLFVDHVTSPLFLFLELLFINLRTIRNIIGHCNLAVRITN